MFSPSYCRRILAALLIAVPSVSPGGNVSTTLSHKLHSINKTNTVILDRGEYVYRTAGCYICHTDIETDAKPMAGGRALPTPYGTFYTPNITPDKTTGIGNWTEKDFTLAMRQGLGLSNKQLYPVFPYTSYTLINDDDLHALWQYLRSQPAVHQRNKPHQLTWFASYRGLINLWKLLFFDPGAFVKHPQKSTHWNQGAYLSQAMAHCGECHTPRNSMGAVDNKLRHAGSHIDSGETLAPNITPALETGIGTWHKDDIITYLQNGMRPDGDTAEGIMADIIDNGLQYLTTEDLSAIASYLQSLPAIDYNKHTNRQ